MRKSQCWVAEVNQNEENKTFSKTSDGNDKRGGNVINDSHLRDAAGGKMMKRTKRPKR